MSTFSTHSGKKTGSRFDQPGAVAAPSLIDCSRVRRRSGWRCGSAAAAQKAPGSHGRTRRRSAARRGSGRTRNQGSRSWPRSKAVIVISADQRLHRVEAAVVGD